MQVLQYILAQRRESKLEAVNPSGNMSRGKLKLNRGYRKEMIQKDALKRGSYKETVFKDYSTIYKIPPWHSLCYMHRII